MPDRDWRGPASFVAFGSVVLAVVLWLAWDLSSLETRERVEAEHAASQYTQDAQDRITRACADAPAYIECVYEEVEATHENKRAEYDLAAQEGMFRWARWMTAVSALGTALTGVGVIFVWLNLSEAREATSIARKEAGIAEAAFSHSQRPWLTIEAEKAEGGRAHYNSTNDNVSIEIKIVVHNISNSAAYCRVGTIFTSIENMRVGKAMYNREKFVDYAEITLFPGKMAKPGFWMTKRFDPVMRGILNPDGRLDYTGIVICVVTYCSTSGGDLFHTSKTFQWTTRGLLEKREDGWSGDFDLSMLMGPSAQTAT
jgi:hypothetical protein